MEWLETFEYLLNELAFVLSYSRLFVIGIGIAFLIVFWGLIMIGLSVREAVKGNRELWEEMQEIKGIISERGEMFYE